MAAILLTACTAVPVERVPLAPPIPIPADARPTPVALRGVRYGVPLGTTTMGISVRNPACQFAFSRSQRRIPPSVLSLDDYRRVFGETLGTLGYDVAGDPARLFDEEADYQRATYEIGARLTDIKIDACREKGDAVFFTYDAGLSGEAMVQVDWTLFDVLRHRKIYRVTTKGYARLDEPGDETVPILLQDAFAAAAHNLGAERAFHDLLVNGTEPPRLPATAADPDEDAVESGRPPVILPPLPLRDGAASLDSLRRVAVLIQTAGGFGSGFFIRDDGLILTNAHVVGHATRVRVVSADKKFRMIADVLRLDSKRDVALLRVQAMPAALSVETLPLRRVRPQVAEDVYAIGAPDLTKLQDTVTKGIVSAIRFNRREKQWYIQSDAFTYPGSSGGPLLDASGNIVGLCVAGYTDGTSDLTGLNLFIPIDDALKALDIH